MGKPASKKTKKKISSEDLRQKLKLKHLETKRKFSEKYPDVEKFFEDKGIKLEDVRKHSAKIIGAGAITGTLLLNPSGDPQILPTPNEVIEKLKDQGKVEGVDTPQKLLVDTLDSVLPKEVQSLTRAEEKFLEQLFQNILGVNTRATLEGEHLNTTFGRIGAEQHLRRYPGDVLLNHGSGDVLTEGIAPGLGAWGYFAPTKAAFTPDLEETERWYAVVQTLYLPDWNTRQPYLRDWYKHRKVLIVNTDNGNAVIAAIADSGPAAWTGKHYGGSPEVMDYLGGPRYKKGPVILFFVDDPENNVPLGPVEYNKLNLPAGSLHEI
ncbi:hypothetical protein KKH23_03665 [Patescibacteria group bacterium]|nr:hypothetical protein [Patescibacteria group bacterium]MBU0776859.1 hypothetical protein [Patescibacteria group bacterium]MBU0846262.1 hypothetical protein [Patescibacteria group bacterium]MBU0922609.1 hypothetical protein [Patescibacteria group bacterium]MBU1066660.1 hypothetical protein [Patescibacteria group bacterium]